MARIRKAIGLTLDPAILQEIDGRRGLVPRSRYIEQLLAESLAASSGLLSFDGQEHRVGSQ